MMSVEREEPRCSTYPQYQAQKVITVSQTAMPRIGDLWPAWIDPANPEQFAVGAPSGSSPEQVAIFREFGIPHPLDQIRPAPAQAPGQLPSRLPPRTVSPRSNASPSCIAALRCRTLSSRLKRPGCSAPDYDSTN